MSLLILPNHNQNIKGIIMNSFTEVDPTEQTRLAHLIDNDTVFKWVMRQGLINNKGFLFTWHKIQSEVMQGLGVYLTEDRAKQVGAMVREENNKLIALFI